MKKITLALALCLAFAGALLAYVTSGLDLLHPAGAQASTPAQATAYVPPPARQQSAPPPTRTRPALIPSPSIAALATTTRARATVVPALSRAKAVTKTPTRTPIRAKAKTATKTVLRQQPTATQPPVQAAGSKAVTVNGRTYDAYVPAATKTKQYYHFTCEFDAAWVVLKTYGIDATLDDQLAQVGQDTSTEPYYKETADGIFIYGGDITQAYSGDYKTNFLARSSGLAMRKVFEHYNLQVTPVHDRAGIQKALQNGQLVWVKVTADFKPGRPSTWVMPDGRTWTTVLGNDHAAVVMGYNSDAVLIRDVLGPTSTNLQRKYEYEVPWDKFLTIWASQSSDGLAVAPPSH